MSGTLSITADAPSSKNEGDSGTTVFSFTVTRTVSTTGPATVDYAVTGNTGLTESDFVGGVLPSGQVIFADGEDEKPISINVAGDTLVESNDVFTVRLSNPTGGATLGTESAIGTILADDVALASAQFTLSTSAIPFGLSGVGSGSAPTFVDIDGDGDLDAFVGELDGNVHFFENTGSSTSAAFAAPVSYSPFGLSGVGLVSAPTFVDIDGDGDVDALVGEDDGNLKFFENTGNATSAAFAAPVTDSPFGLSDVGRTSVPTLIDIDGDGDLDALVGENSGSVVFFENTGSTTSAAFAVPVTNSPFGLTDVGFLATPAFADIDGDGDLDGFVGENFGNVHFFENTGSLTSAAFTLSTNSTPFGLGDVGFGSRPTLVDIDGDGDLDAFVGERDGNVNFFENIVPVQLSIAAADADHAEGDAGTTTFTFTVLRAGNVSYAGTVDYAATGNSGLDAGDFAGGVLPSGTVSFGAGETSKTLTVDVSGDLQVESDEVFTVRLSNPTSVVPVDLEPESAIGTIRTDDTPEIAAQFTLLNNVAPFGLSGVGFDSTPTFVDIDGDGDFDALVGESAGGISFFENTGSPTAAAFSAPVTDSPFGLTDVGVNSTPTFVDIDGDGDLDAFVGESDGNNLNFFENTGSPTAAAFSAPVTNSPFGLSGSGVGFYSAPVLVDIDGDGDLDAFVGQNFGNVSFFENTGNSTSPAFATSVTNSPFGLSDVGFHSTPTLVDIDGDGDLDALVGENDGNINFFENTGSSTSAAFAVPVTGAPFGLSDVGFRSAPTLVDIDGDGDLDVFVGESFPNVNFFENVAPNTGVSIAALDAERAEGDSGATAFTFTVTRAGNVDDAGTVDYAVTGNTGLDALDFDGGVLPSGTVSFGAGETTRTLTLDVSGDVRVESDDVFTVRLSNPTGTVPAGLGTQLAIGTIKTDDVSVAVAQFTLSTSAAPFGLSVGFNSATTFADIDGDGDLDAFVGNEYGSVDFFENTGGSTFAAFATPVTDSPFGLGDVGSYSTPAFADIDGDGDLDAFVGEFDGNVYFFENTGSAISAAFSGPATSFSPFGLSNVGLYSAPTLADIDGDGDLDAFVGGGGRTAKSTSSRTPAVRPRPRLPLR